MGNGLMFVITNWLRTTSDALVLHEAIVSTLSNCEDHLCLGRHVASSRRYVVIGFSAETRNPMAVVDSVYLVGAFLIRFSLRLQRASGDVLLFLLSASIAMTPLRTCKRSPGRVFSATYFRPRDAAGAR